ncbi:unnamed protein product, partial [Ectocarpus fasciculatus]
AARGSYKVFVGVMAQSVVRVLSRTLLVCEVIRGFALACAISRRDLLHRPIPTKVWVGETRVYPGGALANVYSGEKHRDREMIRSLAFGRAVYCTTPVAMTKA